MQKQKIMFTNVVGVYDLSKTFLVSRANPSFRIGITNRQNRPASAPKELIYLPLPDGRRKYLSGLFPVPNRLKMPFLQFTFDIEGVFYVLDFNTDTLTGIISRASKPIRKVRNPKVLSISIGLLSHIMRQLQTNSGTHDRMFEGGRLYTPKHQVSDFQLFIPFTDNESPSKTAKP